MTNAFDQAGQTVLGTQQNADKITNQMTADTIHIHQNQIKAAAAKHWRPLPKTAFVTLASATAWQAMYGQLSVAAVECAPERKFVSFNVFVAAEKRGAEGEGCLVFDLVSPYAQLVPPLGRCQETMRQAFTASREEAIGLREKVRADIEAFEQEWHSSFLVADLVGQSLTCARITIDRSAKTVDVRKAYPLSADPTDYHDHVKRTSELLALLSCWEGQRFLALDVDWNLTHYPLTKLASYLLDERKMDHDRLRINVDDEEEWDFSYPEIDSAIETR